MIIRRYVALSPGVVNRAGRAKVISVVDTIRIILEFIFLK